MKILLLAADLGTGASFTAYQFAGALAARHEVRIAGPAPSGPWPPLREELGNAIRLPPGGALSRTARTALANELDDVQLLYAFKAHPWSLGLGLWARRRFGISLAVHLDDWESGWFADLPFHRRVWNALRSFSHPAGVPRLRLAEARVPRADLVTVSTQALQQRFGGTVIRQGVDAASCDPERHSRGEARRTLGLPQEASVVLFLGTPRRHKGLDDLLASFHRLDIQGARLLLVGSSGEAPDEEDVSTSRVVHRPMVPFREAAGYMVAADVFVVPQRATPYARHQFPAKILHAMAFGLPVVATDVGDAREVLGGDPPAGILVPPGNAGALDAALRDLLVNEGLRASLAAEARTRAVQRYGWEAMGRQLESAFRESGLV